MILNSKYKCLNFHFNQHHFNKNIIFNKTSLNSSFFSFFMNDRKSPGFPLGIYLKFSPGKIPGIFYRSGFGIFPGKTGTGLIPFPKNNREPGPFPFPLSIPVLHSYFLKIKYFFIHSFSLSHLTLFIFSFLPSL